MLFKIFKRENLKPTTSTIKIHLSSCHCKSYATFKIIRISPHDFFQ